MTDAFDVARVITRTNSLYKELKTQEQEYTGDFMGRTLVGDYHRMISILWSKLEYPFLHRLCKSVRIPAA